MKWLVSNYGQNKSYFWHFFSCWFFIFFSDNSKWFWNVHTNNNLHSLYMRYVSSDEDFEFWDFLVLFRFPKWAPCHSLLPISMFLSSFFEWNSWQLIIFKVKHTWNNFFARQEMQEIYLFQNQNDTCAHLFTLVMKFHDRQSSERCIRRLISRHCLDKTRTRWNDFLFLITDDRDFRPQTCTNGLVFRECKHIKNIFEDVYFTKNSFHITLTASVFEGSTWIPSL
jgi:hypothetical protein